MQNNPVLRVAWVAVVAILAMVFMISLFNRYSERHTIVGGAYMAPPGNTLVFDESGSVGFVQGNQDPNIVVLPVIAAATAEEQQDQLAEVINEQDPQVKLQKAREMSRFMPGQGPGLVVWDAGDQQTMDSSPSSLINPGALEYTSSSSDSSLYNNDPSRTYNNGQVID